jgi:thioredoxin-like negative regulator of GroEL
VLLLACAAACGEDFSHANRQIAERDAALTEIARLQALLGERPGDHETLTKLANQQWAVGDYDSAQRSFARALQISRDRDTTVQLVGLLSSTTLMKRPVKVPLMKRPVKVPHESLRDRVRLQTDAQ